MKNLFKTAAVMSAFFWVTETTKGAVITLNSQADSSISTNELQTVTDYLATTLKANYDIARLAKPPPRENNLEFLQSNDIDYLLTIFMKKNEQGQIQLAGNAIDRATVATGVAFSIEANDSEQLYNDLYHELIRNNLLHSPFPSHPKETAIILLGNQKDAASEKNRVEERLAAAIAKESTLQWTIKAHSAAKTTAADRLLPSDEIAGTNRIAVLFPAESTLQVNCYQVVHNDPVETTTLTLSVSPEDNSDIAGDAATIVTALSPPVILRREESIAFLSKYKSFALPLESKWTVSRPLRYNVHPRTKKQTLVQEEAVGTIAVKRILPDSVVVEIINGNDLIGENLICRPVQKQQ